MVVKVETRIAAESNVFGDIGNHVAARIHAGHGKSERKLLRSGNRKLEPQWDFLNLDLMTNRPDEIGLVRSRWRGFNKSCKSTVRGNDENVLGISEPPSFRQSAVARQGDGDGLFFFGNIIVRDSYENVLGWGGTR